MRSRRPAGGDVARQANPCSRGSTHAVQKRCIRARVITAMERNISRRYHDRARRSGPVKLAAAAGGAQLSGSGLRAGVELKRAAKSPPIPSAGTCASPPQACAAQTLPAARRPANGSAERTIIVGRGGPKRPLSLCCFVVRAAAAVPDAPPRRVGFVCRHVPGRAWERSAATRSRARGSAALRATSAACAIFIA